MTELEGDDQVISLVSDWIQEHADATPPIGILYILAVNMRVYPPTSDCIFSILPSRSQSQLLCLLLLSVAGVVPDARFLEGARVLPEMLRTGANALEISAANRANAFVAAKAKAQAPTLRHRHPCENSHCAMLFFWIINI